MKTLVLALLLLGCRRSEPQAPNPYFACLSDCKAKCWEHVRSEHMGCDMSCNQRCNDVGSPFARVPTDAGIFTLPNDSAPDVTPLVLPGFLPDAGLRLVPSDASIQEAPDR